MRGLGYKSVLLIALLLSAATQVMGAESTSKDKNWPSFRGAGAVGVADGYSTATTWDAEKRTNVLWKTAIPGIGHSSPTVWGNRVFVTTAVSGKSKDELKIGLYGDIASVNDDTEHQWKVYCLDKRSGKILWERTAKKGVPKVKRHTKATHANCTMATDGKNLIALFGSEGLYCYDLNGTLRWEKDLGVMDSGYYVVPSAQWEYASSPILFGNSVVVQCDIQKGSFLAAYSTKDGSPIWRTSRDDVPTWSTPTVSMAGNRAVLIVNGLKHIGGYDAHTGKELWRMTGGGDIPVPTPVVSNGLAYIMNAHGKASPIYAVRVEASGDISLQGDQQSNSGVAWSTQRGGSYMQTPMVYGDLLYTCQINGILGCYDAKSGKVIYQERLGTGRTGFTASPVASDGKIYFTSEEGDIYVVKAGREFKVLATNTMGEVCMASPALSEGTIFFRTQAHIVAIREKVQH